MRSFASVNELISHLREESVKSERFAARFILIQGSKTWVDLINSLTCEVDRVVRLSEFCSGPDVFPDMWHLVTYLKQEVAECHSVMLIPLAECIRLDPQNAAILRTLTQLEAYKLRRIYVPLLSLEHITLSIIQDLLRYKSGDLPELWSLKGEGRSEIIAAPFGSSCLGMQEAKGIKEYLAMWEQGGVRQLWLVTDMARWLPSRQDNGNCQLHLYPSGFEFVRSHTGIDNLCEEWGAPRQWEWLAAQFKIGWSLDQVAGQILNITGFNADHLLTLWSGLNDDKRWLVWLWSKERCKPGTYLHQVMMNSRKMADFSYEAIMAIFDFELPPPLPVIRERKKLLQLLGVNLMPAEFLERYHQLAHPLDRIAVLTDLSAMERELIVQCVGELLAKHPRELWWDYLETSFPELSWYLQPASTDDEFSDRYFPVYNSCRLRDRADNELASLINSWACQQILWGYQGRSDLLAEMRANGAKVLWVDAMGVEWTGLLIQLLMKSGQVECEVRVTRAHLPTTTEANREWESGEEVIRGLDDIAHHYDYQFPKSLLKSIDVINSVAQKALALLSQHPTVVITSDHGLSRFAAISDLRVKAPEGAKIEAQGRYVLLQTGGCEEDDSKWIKENNSAYLLTHSRFKGGGPVHGEVHSGATPEECLIPVIVIRKRRNTEDLPPLIFDLVTAPVKLNLKGDGIMTLRCNRRVRSVELRVAGRLVQGQKGAGFTWSFNLKGWKAGNYTGKLYSDHQLVGEISFVVVKGIIEDDLGL